MTPSMDDLLVRQVSALVSETADAVCANGENIPSMEAQFYRALAIHCAEKQGLAAAAFASGVASSARKGVIYW
jgi:hypothetical protein